MQGEKDKIEKIDNRENILYCATHLFYAKGYDAVGVQEIAQVAGITKPTLYYYFKSKYGLLKILLEQKCNLLMRELKQAGEQGENITEALFQVAKAYFIIFAKDKEFGFLMISLFYSARDNEAYQAIKPYMMEQFSFFKGLFERASNILGNMHGRQEQFALGFLGIINLYVLAYYEREVTGDKLVDDRMIYSLVHQFMHGIFS